MKIAVGSKNPVKIEAARNAFGKAFGNCEVVGVSVPSGVSNMPVNPESLLEGARNRALAAMQKMEADFGVGMEGGFETVSNQL